MAGTDLSYHRIVIDGFEDEEQAIVIRTGKLGESFVTERFDYRSDRWVEDADLYHAVFFQGENRHFPIDHETAEELIRRGREIARGE